MRPQSHRRAVAASAIGVLLVIAGLGSSGQAADFTCGAGDAACLVTAIRTANTLTEPSTIRLAAGIYTLSAIDNETNGPNGLPSVSKTVSIQDLAPRSPS
jgi:hypothetical protein